MKNLSYLFNEIWQVARNSKLLWLFSLVNGLTVIIIKVGDQEIFPTAESDFSLLCSGLVLYIFGIFMALFNAFALPYCSGLAIQKREHIFDDVWDGFKTYFLRFLLLGALCLVYLPIFIMFDRLLWRLLSPLENMTVFRQYINLPIGYILFGSPIFLSPYGLLFQNMGVFRSFTNGFKVFFQNWRLFIVVCALPEIINFTIHSLITLMTLVINGQSLTLENYYVAYQSLLPFVISKFVYYSALVPVTILAFALSYFNLSHPKGHPASKGR